MQVNDQISLIHLDRMTDSAGVIQHAIYDIPRRESGYTTDDNARALRLCVRLWNKRPEERMLQRITTYLSFLEFARGVGRGFHNFLSYDRRWLDVEGGGDSQGQAILALAETLGSGLPDGYAEVARELIESALPTLADLRSIRSQAYVVIAWGYLRDAGVEDIESLEAIAWSAARRLAECYYREFEPGWNWFESRMTYANAVLPHALFVAAKHWPREDFLKVAEETFDFLERHTTVEGIFWPIGNEGWFSQGQEKASYDQQPVEAVTMADAALFAFELLNEEKYLAVFNRAHAWFYGRNSLRKQLANVHDGSCCDGLESFGVNRNRGAESTLAFLWTELNSKEISPCAETTDVQMILRSCSDGMRPIQS